MLIEKRRQGALTPWLRQQQWLAGKSAKPGTTATLTLRLTRRASLLVQCCWYTRLSWNTQIGVRIDKRAESSGRVADGTLGPNRAPATVHNHIVPRCAIPPTLLGTGRLQAHHHTRLREKGGCGDGVINTRCSQRKVISLISLRDSLWNSLHPPGSTYLLIWQSSD